jgi:hypothetical protein
VPSDAAVPGRVRKVVALVTHPMFFFVAGFVFAVFAVLALLGSLVGMALRGRAWFDGVVWFLLLFIVCQAACGILEILRRAESKKGDHQ